MKFLKKLGLILLLIVVLLIGAAIAIPILFKDKITATAKERINENVEAVVDFEDASLSFFRSFPNLNFRLTNFSVVGKEQFEGVPLVKGENFDIAVDLMTAIKGNIIIKSINLDHPNINVYVLEDGSANYDIVAASEGETSSESGDFQVELQSYEIEEGRIHYNDKTLGMVTTLANINHSGKGNFTADIFDLDTETEIKYTSLKYDGIQYLDSATVNLDAIFNANLTEQKYTLKDNDLLINDLKLNADGYVQLTDGDDINMDLSFAAPDNEFKELLSLLPNAYSEDFGKVNADGEFEFKGFVSGLLNTVKEQYPAFEVNLNIKDADFQYPDLPVGINKINTATKVSNPGGSLDGTFVDVEQFSMLVGKDPVEGYLKLKTPLSDPNSP